MRIRPIHTFLIKFSRLILLIFILDQGIGFLMELLYKNQQSGPHQRIAYALNETREDLIILGSSRATHHYIPACFEEEMGLKTFNSGANGRSVLFANAMFEGILSRYTPQSIILEVYPLDFYHWEEAHARMDILLPYYHDIPQLQPILNNRNKYEPLKMLSRIYPYNSMLLTILNYQINEQEAYMGYRPKRGSISSDSLISLAPGKYMVIDQERVNAFENIIQKCKDKRIDLYLFISPIYNKIPDNESLRLTRRISENHNIPFWDFSQHEDFLSNPELFNDHYHLNECGANLYSMMAIEKILSYRQNKPIGK